MRLAEFQGVIKDYVHGNAQKPRELILVQAKDDQGFWCNVREGVPVKQAVIIAQEIAEQNHIDTRVVKGQKRELVREFFGK